VLIVIYYGEVKKKYVHCFNVMPLWQCVYDEYKIFHTSTTE